MRKGLRAGRLGRMRQRVEFLRLGAASLVWFLLHAAVAGSSLRSALISRLGDRRYRNAFSLLSLASLWWLVHEFGRAPYVALWRVPEVLLNLPLLVMPAAMVLVVGAFLVPSPTALGGERHLVRAGVARGVLRITRHPFLWGVVLWSLAHLAVSGDLGSWLFFTSFLATALRGGVDIDRRRRQQEPEAFGRFEAETSNLPGLALRQRRARLVGAELVLPVALGLLLTAGLLYLHPYVIRAPALPAWLRGSRSVESRSAPRSLPADPPARKIPTSLRQRGHQPEKGRRTCQKTISA